MGTDQLAGCVPGWGVEGEPVAAGIWWLIASKVSCAILLVAIWDSESFRYQSLV